MILLKFSNINGVAVAHIKSKSTLRKSMLFLRSNLKLTSQDAESFEKNLLNFLFEKNFSSVFCYLSQADEAPTWPLINNLIAKSVRVTCPRIIDKQTMIAVRLADLNNLERGPLGIYTSPESTPYRGAIDTAIVPGLAFTRRGERLGYGGGYYDRWFKKYADCYRVALCYEAQLLDSIPTEAHDVPMDAIVTERSVYNCAPA